MKDKYLKTLSEIKKEGSNAFDYKLIKDFIFKNIKVDVIINQSDCPIMKKISILETQITSIHQKHQKDLFDIYDNYSKNEQLKNYCIELKSLKQTIEKYDGLNLDISDRKYANGENLSWDISYKHANYYMLIRIIEDVESKKINYTNNQSKKICISYCDFLLNQNIKTLEKLLNILSKYTLFDIINITIYPNKEAAIKNRMSEKIKEFKKQIKTANNMIKNIEEKKYYKISFNFSNNRVIFTSDKNTDRALKLNRILKKQ